MKILVLIFVALLVTGLAAWLAQTQGGEVIVYIADLTVHTSLLMALLIGTGIMLGLFVLVWLLARTLETPQRLRKRHRHRRHERADNLLAKGLRNMLENRLDAARQNLEQAAKTEPKQSLFRLLAASACVRSNDRDAWSGHLRAIDDPDYQAASTWLKADGLIAAEEWEEALAVLQVLAGDNPNHPRILRQLARCYRELNSWERLFELGRDQLRHSNLPQDETRQWLRDAAHRLCENTTDMELKALWPKLGDARDDPEVLRSYAERLRYYGQTHPELEPHLCKLLDAGLDDAAIELYGTLPGPATPDMIVRVRKWLKQDPERASLRRALARLHSRLGQHREAQTQLEALEKQGGDALLYRELAETLERMGQGEAAQAYYRKGLQSLTRTP